jgi:glycosyltransferase involved in cell wall biosynthesis
MNYPKITIITPSYNQGQFIEETILSVINQNYPNLEYIIIDGGSTDNSIDIIKKYEKYIAYWVSEKDSGQANAINKGLKIASGEIVNWINSDDLLSNGALDVIANLYISNKKVDLICGAVENFSKNGSLSIVFNSKITFSTFISGQNIWHQPGIWFNFKKFPDLYVNDNYNFCFDFLLMTEILQKKMLFICETKFTLVRFRIHLFSKTGSGNVSYFQEMISILNLYISNKNYSKYHNSIKNYLYKIKKNYYCNFKVNKIITNDASRFSKFIKLLYLFINNIIYCCNRYYFGSLRKLICNER